MGLAFSHYKYWSHEELHNEVEYLERQCREKDTYIKCYNEPDNSYLVGVAIGELDKMRRAISYIEKLPQY